MATYSFLDVLASIAGPGGSFSLGSGAGASEEGITISYAEEKNTMTVGADGKGMHSLHAGKSGKVTINLLKTSPVNAQLAALYNAQTASSALHGQNVITVNDVSRGDTMSARQCAFAKFPDIVYAKDGNMNAWEFHAIEIDPLLGTGSPEV